MGISYRRISPFGLHTAINYDSLYKQYHKVIMLINHILKLNLKKIIKEAPVEKIKIKSLANRDCTNRTGWEYMANSPIHVSGERETNADEIA